MSASVEFCTYVPSAMAVVLSDAIKSGTVKNVQLSHRPAGQASEVIDFKFSIERREDSQDSIQTPSNGQSSTPEVLPGSFYTALTDMSDGYSVRRQSWKDSCESIRVRSDGMFCLARSGQIGTLRYYDLVSTDWVRDNELPKVLLAISPEF